MLVVINCLFACSEQTVVVICIPERKKGLIDELLAGSRPVTHAVVGLRVSSLTGVSSSLLLLDPPPFLNQRHKQEFKDAPVHRLKDVLFLAIENFNHVASPCVSWLTWPT